MGRLETLAPSVIDAAGKSFFKENGYLVVRNLLTPEELEILRARANVLATPSNGHVSANRDARKAAEERSAKLALAAGGDGMGADMGTDMMSPSQRIDPKSVPEERLSPQHGRRGPYIFNLRTRPVDPAARAAALASGDPLNHVEVTVENLCDMDQTCRRFAAHPKIIAVLNELLGPNLKMWYDHLFSKPPFNDSGPYRGANRYHQDGFFFFSEPSATCWIALDEATRENGCLRYIPLTAGYGRFPQFDVIAHGIGLPELEQEVLVPLHTGDAAFHDRMTVHGTGPNETGKSRPGWALHYTKAESTWGDFRFDPTAEPYTYRQTPDGLHLRNGRVTGNRDYLLVSGQEFPGCV